jgi:DNA polymerase III delta prime subunit
MNLLLHALTKQKYDAFAKNPPQSILLVSPAGSGKQTLLARLAFEILGDKPIGRLFEISPLKDKNSIGIEAIRSLKNSLRLKSDKKRVILINDAGALTLEAQNSLLKILEEPPKDVHFLMSINTMNDLLETIRSRSTIWRLTLPSKEQVVSYLTDYNSQEAQQAVAIAGNKIGLVISMLDKNQESALLNSVNSAKEMMGETHFKRLITANQLSKDPDEIKNMLEALILICHAALRHSASNNSINTKKWQKRLSNTLKAQYWLDNNVQPKLVLSYLFIVL